MLNAQEAISLLHVFHRKVQFLDNATYHMNPAVQLNEQKFIFGLLRLSYSALLMPS